MDTLKNILKDKTEVWEYLFKVVEQSDSLKKTLVTDDKPVSDDMVREAIDLLIYQNDTIKRLSAIMLVYISSSDMDVDIARLLNKMGHGDEAMNLLYKKILGEDVQK